MDPSKAKRILSKRRRLSTNVDPKKLFDASFPQQEAFYRDPAKLKAIFCTRRAAKSYTAGLCMVAEALGNPGCNILFIGLSRASAKAIIWKDILKVLNRKYGLGARFHLTELSMTFPNGSVIRILGVDAEEKEMDKLLGGKYRLVCIDEASMYSVDLRKLVYGILKPAMTDPNSGGQRGSICLMGTSSNYTRGLFYDITTGKEQGWSLHSWSAHDNPFVSKQWQEELDEIERLRPLYKETPQFKQWYLNQWVIETDKLVYKFNEERNLFVDIPNHQTGAWYYVLGVDLGWEDDNAFTLCGFHEHDPHFYVIKSFAKPHMSFDEVANKIREFMNDENRPPSKIIIDGANKQGVESMRIKTSIPFEYADKQGKVDFIEMMNADLIQGIIKISREERDLRDELMSLVWRTDGDKIVFPKKEHPTLPNHRADSLLYAWRNGFHANATPIVEKVVKGSKRWYELQAENIWEREAEKLRREMSGDAEYGWPDTPDFMQ